MSESAKRPADILDEQAPALVFVLSLVTFGIYLLFWYYRLYSDWSELTGRTPTGNSYGWDLLLQIVTCGVWGIYVDYQISEEISRYRRERGLPAQDSSLAVVALDIAAYFTITITYLVSTAMHQNQLNELRDAGTGTLQTET